MKKLATCTIGVLLLVSAMISILSNTVIASPGADQDFPIITGTIKTGLTAPSPNSPAGAFLLDVATTLQNKCADATSFTQVGPTTQGDSWHIINEVWATGGGYGIFEQVISVTTAPGWWNWTWWYGLWDRQPTELKTTSIYTSSVTGRVYTSTLVTKCPQIAVDGAFGPSQTFTATNAGSGITYTWSFGDGQTAVGNPVSHSFDHPGKYTVIVTGTNDFGSAANTMDIAVVQRYFLPMIYNRSPIIKR